MFIIIRFRYIEVLFHKFYYYWGKEFFFIPRTSLYRGSFYRGSTVTKRVKNYLRSAIGVVVLYEIYNILFSF